MKTALPPFLHANPSVTDITNQPLLEKSVTDPLKSFRPPKPTSRPKPQGRPVNFSLDYCMPSASSTWIERPLCGMRSLEWWSMKWKMSRWKTYRTWPLVQDMLIKLNRDINLTWFRCYALATRDAKSMYPWGAIPTKFTQRVLVVLIKPPNVCKDTGDTILPIMRGRKHNFADWSRNLIENRRIML